MRARSALRVERGDWQTPLELARRVVARTAASGFEPASIVEPTCGLGHFLIAAGERFPRARLLGYDISLDYVEASRRALGRGAAIRQADFFATDWSAELRELEEPIWVVGNPPWVTSATLGMLGSPNHPVKTNRHNKRGLSAMTGESNFDLAEAMILALLEAGETRELVLTMLCKAQVARRVIEYAANRRLSLRGELCDFDARAYFGAAVDAGALELRGRREVGTGALLAWPHYSSLDAPAPARLLAIAHTEDSNPVLCSDLADFQRTRGLAGPTEHRWRSGVKHDCAKVLELRRDGDSYVNGFGERVDVEGAYVFPLRKGSDVANSRAGTGRALIVPQRRLNEDTGILEHGAPRLWSYLSRHRARFEARKSRVYRGAPAFAMFGLGPYSFAPFKVAICGLYKRLAFTLVGPVGEKPTMLDDTVYFLAFDDERAAQEALEVLQREDVRAFFEARVFWDAKRPIRKSLLQTLSLERALVAR